MCANTMNRIYDSNEEDPKEVERFAHPHKVFQRLSNTSSTFSFFVFNH